MVLTTAKIVIKIKPTIAILKKLFDLFATGKHLSFLRKINIFAEGSKTRIDMLEIGNVIPEFAAQDQNGNIVSSAGLIGKKTVVYFYPKANTPGCTAEAC